MQNFCQRNKPANGKVGFMARFKRIKAPKSPYMNYLLMLAAPAIVSWYYYGALAFRAILTGIISAVAVEAVALLIMKRKLNCLSDMHAVFTGFAIAMLLPATDLADRRGRGVCNSRCKDSVRSGAQGSVRARCGRHGVSDRLLPGRGFQISRHRLGVVRCL